MAFQQIVPTLSMRSVASLVASKLSVERPEMSSWPQPWVMVSPLSSHIGANVCPGTCAAKGVPAPECAPPSPAEPKILCLSGGGQSAASFANDAGMQALTTSLGSTFEFVYAEPPEEYALWIRDPPGGKGEPTTDANWASTSVNFLNELILSHGPFFGILGYSQGSAMSILLLAHVPIGTFQVAMLFCGYIPTTHSGLSNLVTTASPFGDIHALVWMGANDATISNAMTTEQASMFTSPTVVVSANGGHAVPDDSDPTFTSIVSFLQNAEQGLGTPLPFEKAKASRGRARAAVDGDVGTFMKVKRANTPWFSARVPSGTAISSVSVHNRDCSRRCQRKLRGYEVWIGTSKGDISSNQAHKCGGPYTNLNTGVGPFITNCNGTTAQRWVTVLLPGPSQTLLLAEVHAFE